MKHCRGLFNRKDCSRLDRASAKSRAEIIGKLFKEALFNLSGKSAVD